MIQRLGARALLGATAVLALAVATPASAQRITRIVAFGDSYVDFGNAFRFGGQPFPTAYPQGRFSNSTNYVDTLAALLGNVPVDNFAIGGAKTDNSNVTAGLPGFATEYTRFLAGGGPAPFSTVSGRFGPTDLLLINIGGNDARDYQQRGGTVAGGPVTQGSLAGAPQAGLIAAANAKAGLDLLVGSGARTISFLAGDSAGLPEVLNDANARAVRNAFANSFNPAIRQTLAGYANNGVVVHYTDLTLIGNRVQSNYGAYGLQGLACPALPNTSCITTPGEADKYLFYFDQVHLTAAGFAIVGRYSFRQLQAPLNLGATSDLALDSARQFGRTLNTRMDLGSPRDGEVLEGARFFVTGDSFSRDVGASFVTDAFDVDSVGATAGAEVGFGGNGLIGAAIGINRGKARMANASARLNGDALQGGIYAAYALGPVFAQGHAGYGRTEFDITRAGVIDDLSAKPEGSHVVAGAKVGFLAGLGPLRVGPVAAIDYARAKIDGYTETGDAALSLNVGQQRYSALVGGLGLELRGDLDAGGSVVRPFASAMIEKDLKGNSRTLVFSQTSAPTIVNRFDLGERDTGVYSRFSGGASAQLARNIQLEVAGSTTAGKDQGNEVSVLGGVRVGF
nr:autotransporter domain-containing protein [uncultured Sphingomonas sp.]